MTVLVLYGILLWGTSIYPSPPPVVSVGGFDKLLHLLEYVPFGYLLSRVVARQHGGVARARYWAVTLAGSALMGLLCEASQAFLPTRSFEVADLAADLLGGALGGLWFQRRHHLRYG